MKRLKYFFIFGYILLTTSLLAGVKYPISEIPEALKKNAEAVIRIDESKFDLLSKTSAKLSHKYVVTIFNENSLDLSKQYLFYDQFTKIKDISCVVYNPAGEKVKSIQSDKILDFSAVAGFSLFDDNRVKLVDADYAIFPFTVEFEWEVVYSGTLLYPRWMPYDDYSVSIQQSSLIVTADISMAPLRFLELNGAPACVKITDSKSNSYYWSVSDLLPIKKEQFSMGLDQYTPIVHLAPSDFSLDGHEGNLDSWNNLGKWVNELNKGRGMLSDETKSQMIELVKNATSDEEKIKLLYKYMQQKVRYVNLALGIGGWQPIEAQRTDKVSYGDCKGLTNYMKALLDAVNIKSIYTLARAGALERDILGQFPSSQFNHAFLCVPVSNDTIWLECTSQRNPFGFLGTFTDDRDVLLITDDGGELVHTPVYTIKENVNNTRIEVNLDENGDIDAVVNSCNKGLFYDDLEQVIGMDEHDRKEFLMESIHLSGFEVPLYAYTPVPDQPVINLNMEILVRKYANVVNKQVILRPNILNRVINSPDAVINRKSKVILRREWQENDTITYTLPAGSTIGSLPKDIDLQSDFGHYKATFRNENSKLVYTRQFTRFKGVFEPEKYSLLVSFYDKIRKADETKLPIVL
ncbi:MAG: DUF3857 and transglutaminase domain-containing protein [Bacteroidales bacterium]|nr:DUF3857 and transglutaminase domain-containing protein [Bacteroidales bacterium]